MADAPVVHIGENSPEHVAYRLMHEIAAVEGIVFYRSKDADKKSADRNWILNTYVDCLAATRGARPR